VPPAVKFRLAELDRKDLAGKKHAKAAELRKHKIQN